MDWLFREYTNPFSLLDSLIQNNRFNEWVDKFLESHNRKIQWEFWLHKDFEHTWQDFIGGTETHEESQSMSDEQMTSIVQDTYSMMNGFTLEEGDE